MRTPTDRQRLRRVFMPVVCGSVLAACGASADVRAGDVVGRRPATAITATTTPRLAPTTSSPMSSSPVTTTTPVAPGTTTPAGTTTRPAAALDCINPAELPLMVAADDQGYDTVQIQEGLGSSDDRERAIFTAGGAVATQVRNGDTYSVEYRIGPAGGIGPKGIIKNAVLYDLVAAASGPMVLYGELAQGDDVAASMRLLDVGSGDSIVIADSQNFEYFVYAADAAAGFVVSSATADLTEDISTWSLDGSGAVPGRYNPVTPDKYGLPPFYGPAVLSPDGTRLAWLEGPDTDTTTGEKVGSWQLVVADSITGSEQARLDVGTVDDVFSGFDWNGEWAVLSRGHGQPVDALRTTDTDPAVQPVCTAALDDILTGIVTFVIVTAAVGRGPAMRAP